MDEELLWDNIIFFTVLSVIIVFLLETFFETEPYEQFILAFEIIVFFIFLADLKVLYSKATNFKNFIKMNWLDIIATIPFSQMFQVAKLLRFLRIMKSFKLFAKSTKLIHLERAIKIFSKKEAIEDEEE